MCKLSQKLRICFRIKTSCSKELAVLREAIKLQDMFGWTAHQALVTATAMVEAASENVIDLKTK
jgi:hypothetical protein